MLGEGQTFQQLMVRKIRHLNLRPKTIHLLEENIVENYNLGLSEDVLEYVKPMHKKITP